MMYDKLAGIKSEISKDPLGIYAGLTTVDQLKTALTTINREKSVVVPMWMFIDKVIDSAEFEGLGEVPKQAVQATLTSMSEIDASSGFIARQLALYFDAGSVTISNLKKMIATDRLGELGLPLPTDHELAVILGLE